MPRNLFQFDNTKFCQQKRQQTFERKLHKKSSPYFVRRGDWWNLWLNVELKVSLTGMCVICWRDVFRCSCCSSTEAATFLLLFLLLFRPQSLPGCQCTRKRKHTERQKTCRATADLSCAYAHTSGHTNLHCTTGRACLRLCPHDNRRWWQRLEQVERLQFGNNFVTEKSTLV